MAYGHVAGYNHLSNCTLKRTPGYPLKEFWIRIGREFYNIPPPHASCGLETLIVETAYGNTSEMLYRWLSPQKSGVPFPLLSTIELRNEFAVISFGRTLKARSNAGNRLRTLRIRWYDGCEVRTACLAQFVDRLDIYHVDGKASHGMELPEECMERSRWWGPWGQSFTGGMEPEPLEESFW